LSVQAFAWRGWVNPLKTSVRVARNFDLDSKRISLKCNSKIFTAPLTSRGSMVSDGLRAGRPGSDARGGGGKVFSLLHSVQTGLAPPLQPPIQWVPDALSPGVEPPERGAVHLPPSTAAVKNSGAVPPLPIRLHGMVLN
jgi:hypothetical protein